MQQHHILNQVDMIISSFNGNLSFCQQDVTNYLRYMCYFSCKTRFIYFLLSIKEEYMYTSSFSVRYQQHYLLGKSIFF